MSAQHSVFFASILQKADPSLVQWEFQSCGAGFIIKSVSSGLFLSIDGNMEVVPGQIPLCWEMEIMDNGSAHENGGDSGVYVRYVLLLFCSAWFLSSVVALASECHKLRCI